MADKIIISVIGATGRTGVPLVTQALARGHRVRALVRSPQKAADVLRQAAELVTGDALDPSAVSRLVKGADVVIDVSGPVRGGPHNYRQQSTDVLLDAMAGSGDGRLLHLTGAGVRQPNDRPSLIDRVARGAMLVMARQLLHDSTAAVDAVQAGRVDALVVRAPRLTEGARTGKYHVAQGVGLGSGIRIARADLATALLDFAEADAWASPSLVVSAAR